MLKTLHRLAFALPMMFGVVFLVIGATFTNRDVVIANVASAIGGSLLAVGVVELIFRTALQEHLIQQTVSTFRTALNLPVEAVYLRRRDVPSRYSFTNVLREAKSDVHVRAITFAVVHTGGLVDDLEDGLANNPNIRIHLYMLHPSSPFVAAIAVLGKTSEAATRGSMESLLAQLAEFKMQHPDRFFFSTYDSMPTGSIWIVDPQGQEGWIRSEFLPSPGRSAEERINVVIRRRDDPRYFDSVCRSILPPS